MLLQACKMIAEAIPLSTRLQSLDLRRNSSDVSKFFVAAPETLKVLL